jgi:Fe-S cluster biogenesis protein NfuA
MIARGGALRVSTFEDGVLTLEASGSPGATYPMTSRIEAVVRAAVPEVSQVKVVVPDGTSTPTATGSTLAERVQQVVDREINPAVAVHRGRITLVGLEDGWASIRLEGGCQGCSLAAVTVRQGVEPLLRERVPELVGVVDVTDHAAGTEPFYSPSKR